LIKNNGIKKLLFDKPARIERALFLKIKAICFPKK